MALINSGGGDPYETAVPQASASGGGGQYDYQPPSFSRSAPTGYQTPQASLPGGTAQPPFGAPETRPTQPYMPRTFDPQQIARTYGDSGFFWPGNPTPAYAPGSAGSTPSNMPQGIDPMLAAIYQNAGVNPADRGTGFADWQYWQGVGPSQYSRLAADIAGRGPDQPTGTPWGQGAWMNSGAGGSPSGDLSGTGGDLSGFLNLFTQLLQPLYSQVSQLSQSPAVSAPAPQSSVLTNPAFWQSISGLFQQPQQTTAPAPNFTYGVSSPYGYGYGSPGPSQANPSQALNSILALLASGG